MTEEKLTAEEEIELIYQVMAGSNWPGIEHDINQSKIARRLRDYMQEIKPYDTVSIYDGSRMGISGSVQVIWFDREQIAWNAVLRINEDGESKRIVVPVDKLVKVIP